MSRLPNKSPEPTAVGAYRSAVAVHAASRRDRKSTRLNSSHQIISYAVFCLKKKKTSVKAARHISVHSDVSMHGLVYVPLRVKRDGIGGPSDGDKGLGAYLLCAIALHVSRVR